MFVELLSKIKTDVSAVKGAVFTRNFNDNAYDPYGAQPRMIPLSNRQQSRPAYSKREKFEHDKMASLRSILYK